MRNVEIILIQAAINFAYTFFQLIIDLTAVILQIFSPFSVTSTYEKNI